MIMSLRQTIAPSLYGRFLELSSGTQAIFVMGTRPFHVVAYYSDPLLRSAVILKRHALRGTFCPRISTRRSNSSMIKSLKD